MKKPSRLEKMGATPGKLALIAVLAGVLVFVIVRQLPGSQDNASKASVTASPKREVAASAVEKALQDQTPKVPLAPWPHFKTSTMLASDPFALPPWAIEEVKESENAQVGKLVDLQRQGASAIVITSEGKSASIGDRNVHVGDVLEGYQITDITAQGIVLHKLSSN